MSARPRDPARLAIRRELEVNRDARDAVAAIKAHLKMCARCTAAGDNWYGRCDTGWELTKAMSRTRYAKWKKDERKRDDNQGTLW